MAMRMFLPNGLALRIIMRVVFTIICVIVYLSSRCKGAIPVPTLVRSRPEFVILDLEGICGLRNLKACFSITLGLRSFLYLGGPSFLATAFCSTSKRTCSIMIKRSVKQLIVVPALQF